MACLIVRTSSGGARSRRAVDRNALRGDATPSNNAFGHNAQRASQYARTTCLHRIKIDSVLNRSDFKRKRVANFAVKVADKFFC